MRQRLECSPCIAAAERADVGRAPAAEVQRLRQQPGAGRLAVGAGDAGHRQAGRRRIEESIGDVAELRAADSAPRAPRSTASSAGALTPGAGSHRIARAPAATAAVREFQRHGACGRWQARKAAPGRHAAAVLRDVRHFQALGHVDQPAQHRLERPPVRCDSAAFIAAPPAGRASTAWSARSASSGATASSRSAPPTTAENTGADTSPPMYLPAVGSSITTTAARRGLEAGASPAKTEV